MVGSSMFVVFAGQTRLCSIFRRDFFSSRRLGGDHAYPIGSCFFSSLEPPTVLFQDNHLLVVNKPAGWHSVPNPGPHSPKCLLSRLKQMKLGGGSNKDFLLPLHRLDQPCTGVILFAKTSKAATRVTSLWKRKLVEKEYLCVVQTDRVKSLLVNARDPQDCAGRCWYALWGTLHPSRESRSVVVRSIGSHSNEHSGDRKVSVRFHVMDSEIKNCNYLLLRVKTNEGSRHMVRAMLAQVGGCPIAGDMRYGFMDQKSLRDRSVALHAFRLTLDPQLKLGSCDTFEFHAPLPHSWQEFFGLTYSGTR